MLHRSMYLVPMLVQQIKRPAMRPALALAAVLAAFFAAAAPAAAEDVPSERDLACIAEAVYYEARGEPIQGRAAVAYVVLNRARSGEFPRTPCAVVAEGCQFSYRCDGRPEALAVRADRDAAFVTAKAVLTGAVADPTDGALFFHASRIRPGWFETRARVGTIGNHVFYR
jgi:spore germination cell wall hydrolase CwlJ-like protein